MLLKVTIIIIISSTVAARRLETPTASFDRYLVAHDGVDVGVLIEQELGQPEVVGQRSDVETRASVPVGCVDGPLVLPRLQQVLNHL